MITDDQRHQLFTLVEGAFGTEGATILMEALEPSLQADLATVKQDVGELKHDVGILKQDVGELKQDMAVLKMDLRGTEERLESKMGQGLAESTRDIQRTFVTWLLASQTSVAAFVAIVLAVS